MKTLLCLVAFAWFAGFGQTPSTVASDPVLLYKVEAEHSPEARAAKLQGTVYLYVEVSPEGKTENVHVLHGLGLGLDEKAVEAVKQWRFKPGMADEKPERVAQSVAVGFQIIDEPWRIRQAAYKVVGKPTEVLVKPVLSRYAPPDAAACPADGGAAIINLLIGEDGLPGGMQTDHPDDLVSRAATKAMESWRFSPGSADGKPRGANATVEFECGPSTAEVSNPPAQVDGGGAARIAIYHPGPQPSAEAVKARSGGVVPLAVVIDPTGHVARIRVTKALGLGLDEKAMEAVTQWRFKPARKDGKPVSVTAHIEINFRLP